MLLPRVWRQPADHPDAGAGRRAGSGLVFFTQPAFDPGPDGVFFAGQGQLKIEVQSPINSLRVNFHGTRILLFVLEGGSGTTPYCTPIAPAASANIWTTAATTGLAGHRRGLELLRVLRAPGRRRRFTMRPRPVMVTVPYGGGVGNPRVHRSDKTVLEGTYKTKLYAGAFTQMLLQLACQQVNSLGWVGVSGVSSGWQYGPAAGSAGNQCGNLPSVSIFHAIQKSDGTYKHRLYHGVRVKIWSFTLSRKQHDRRPHAPAHRCLCGGESVYLPELCRPTAISVRRLPACPHLRRPVTHRPGVLRRRHVCPSIRGCS